MFYKDINSPEDLELYMESKSRTREEMILEKKQTAPKKKATEIEEDTEAEPEPGDDTSDKKSAKDTAKEPTEKELLAELTEVKNSFKYILFFTNDKSDHNKSMAGITDAIDAINKKCEIKASLLLVDTATCSIVTDKDDTYLDDESGHIVKMGELNNENTLCFVRLTAIEYADCCGIIDVLDKKGITVLNNIESMNVACDKYKTAVLFSKNNIPQPNYCLVDNKVLGEDGEAYEKMLESVYPGEDHTADKFFKKEVVVKVLNGHGGTGIACVDITCLKSWLQFIFLISPDIDILIQAKEKALSGDIRVHVLTLKDRQVILGAMSRQKVKNDFRSNVSLGAKAIPVVLTDEQKEIAKKAAAASGLIWAGVDIMPIEPHNNMNNVVLEVNASSGTKGINEVIKRNILTSIISLLSDSESRPKSYMSLKPVVTVTVTGNGKPIDLTAILDTGNCTRAAQLQVENIKATENEVEFDFNGDHYKKKVLHHSIPLTAAGKGERRSIVEMDSIEINGRKCSPWLVSLVESRVNGTAVNINRRTLSALGIAVIS